MANHYRVSPKFWLKARKRAWTDAQTTLALYLLTCDHRNLEGLYRLPKPYIGADLGWPIRKVEETLAVVCESGFAAYDEAAEMVLIPNALKHQSPSTVLQIKGAIAQIERIPRTSLWHAFVIACRSHCPGLADEIAKRWPSDSDAIPHAHEQARGGSSSSSSSSSNPPQPPEQARGEQDQQIPLGGKLPANSRALGTSPRAVAAAHLAAIAEEIQAGAAAAIEPADEAQASDWERVRRRLQSSASESTWGLYLESLRLAGHADGTLVIDGPEERWSWVSSDRHARLIGRCAEAENVALRLATQNEHDGLRSVAS